MISLFKKACITVSRFTKIPEQMLRFLFIGGVNFLFAYGLYALFIALHFHYTLAVLLSTVIGICFSFKTMGTFVFDNPSNRLIFKFVLVYTMGYFLEIGFLRLLSSTVLPNLYAAGILSKAFVAVISFFLNKFLVFKQNKTAV